MNPQTQPSRFATFSMRWSPEEQTVCCDADTFTHHGPSATDPSHDLAHLLIAASGTLPWKPGGHGKKAKLAEYNAFLIENILDMTYNCITYKSIQADHVLRGALSRARWFVEEHYSPFPMSAEEAFSEFRRKIDGALIVRQSTRFFSQKARERCDPNFRKRTYQLSFKLHEFPPIDETSFAFQEVVSQIMSSINSYSYYELYPDAQQRNVPVQRHDCSFCGFASSFLHQMKLIFSYVMVRTKNGIQHITGTGRRKIIAMALVGAAGLLAGCFERAIPPGLGDLFSSLAAVNDAICRGYGTKPGTAE